MQTLQELGEAIATRRKQLGLKQAVVAVQAGITPESLSRLERGRVAEFGTRSEGRVQALAVSDLHGLDTKTPGRG